jgi:hypothetical protein
MGSGKNFSEEKTHKQCSTPSELENWIVQKIAKGYRFDLDLWRIDEYALDFLVGGIPLKS